MIYLKIRYTKQFAKHVERSKPYRFDWKTNITKHRQTLLFVPATYQFPSSLQGISPTRQASFQTTSGPTRNPGKVLTKQQAFLKEYGQ